jgi:hypothetical protein
LKDESFIVKSSCEKLFSGRHPYSSGLNELRNLETP